MLFPSELLDVIQEAPRGAWEGEVFRHMFGNRAPELANTLGARWNPPNVAAIYVSLNAETAIAEGDHALAVQPMRPKVARWLYRISTKLESMVDMTDEGLLARAGVTATELASDDHSACRLVGGAVQWLGNDGLLVPSARHTGSNLVIFPASLDPHAPFEVIERTSIAD